MKGARMLSASRRPWNRPCPRVRMAQPSAFLCWTAAPSSGWWTLPQSLGYFAEACVSLAMTYPGLQSASSCDTFLDCTWEFMCASPALPTTRRLSETSLRRIRRATTQRDWRKGENSTVGGQMKKQHTGTNILLAGRRGQTQHETEGEKNWRRECKWQQTAYIGIRSPGVAHSV